MAAGIKNSSYKPIDVAGRIKQMCAKCYAKTIAARCPFCGAKMPPNPKTTAKSETGDSMKITITVKGIKCETPEKLAYVLCLTSESNKSAWLKAGNMALRAFPSSPKQQFIKQAERILNERIANSAE